MYVSKQFLLSLYRFCVEFYICRGENDFMNLANNVASQMTLPRKFISHNCWLHRM